MSDLKTEQPPKVLPISVGAVSEIGQREENQDCMTGFSSPFGAVYLIADGMGGHRGGAEASRMVAEAFSRHLLAVPSSSPPRDAVTLAVRLANVEVLEKSKSGNPDFQGMGSTVVIALVRQASAGLELTTAHVGDSRIYLQRNRKLTLLTKDHTQVQWLIDSHAIDEAGARAHPDASVLTRAMGHTTDLQVDISDPIPLADGDGILICSDGLSGFASTEDIHRTIQQNPDPSGCANQLVQLALASGSNDNITVQFLRIGLAQTAPQPKRQTQPDGATLSPRAIPSAKRSTHLIFGVPISIVLAGIVAWFLFHRYPTPAEDPLIAQLTQRVHAFQANTTKLHDDAGAGQDSIHKDIAAIDKMSSGPDKPAKLRSDLKNLKEKFVPLEKRFGDILAASVGFEQDARNRDTELDELRRPAGPTQKPSERQTKINSLTNTIAKNEVSLQASQKELSKAKQTQTDLESRKSQLETEEKARTNALNKPASGRHANPQNSDEAGDVHH
jgi:serine/threonine protein phosphatase PrpC